MTNKNVLETTLIKKVQCIFFFKTTQYYLEIMAGFDVLYQNIYKKKT